MTDFVLVHGAWHGAWCWDKVKVLLESAGHRCHTPELPLELGFADYVDTVVTVIQSCQQPVVLVGHSMAGAVIESVAEALPGQITRLVYLSAFAPQSGQSINDLARFNVASVLRDNVELLDGMLTVKANRVIQAFYHDCDAGDIDAATGRLRPQNPDAFGHQLKLTEARFGSVPKHYIECVEDQAIHISLQRKMARDMGLTHVNSLQTGHSPFFSAPAALAALIATTGIRDARFTS
ncbi:MAG: alpha/beta fold hydrolase [Pseudomonadota bacterium]